MPIAVNIYRGKPHKEGDPPVCTRCNAKLTWPYDMMEDQKGNTWLYCEACSVAMLSDYQIIPEH